MNTDSSDLDELLRKYGIINILGTYMSPKEEFADLKEAILSRYRSVSEIKEVLLTVLNHQPITYERLLAALNIGDET
jgi:hypothetical protein